MRTGASPPRKPSTMARHFSSRPRRMMLSLKVWRARLAVSAIALMTLTVSALSQRRAVDAVATWIALDAPTGREQQATEIIRRELTGWSRDQIGRAHV